MEEVTFAELIDTWNKANKYMLQLATSDNDTEYWEACKNFRNEQVLLENNFERATEEVQKKFRETTSHQKKVI